MGRLRQFIGAIVLATWFLIFQTTQPNVTTALSSWLDNANLHQASVWLQAPGTQGFLALTPWALLLIGAVLLLWPVLVWIVELIAHLFGIYIHSTINISAGESGQYVRAASKMLYQVERTLYLKIKNKSKRSSLHDCRLRILKCKPEGLSGGPWQLGVLVSLAPGDHAFVPFARYGEAKDAQKFNCADSFLRFATENEHPTGGRDARHTAVVQATAHGSGPCVRAFRVWVDATGRLRIRQAPWWSRW